MKRRGFLAAVGGLLLAAAFPRPPIAAGRRPKLVGTWNGRVVLWGLAADPKNWFVSGLNDPTCFNYATDGTQPKRGT